ncbi:SRPBCC family protein [Streptomyces lydicus]|uniref:Activator of HSP90 ATPase n=1 Tax=Streptomyces lydicus TaxID=47763 RepID=A0A1D7VNC2_9ACTN|nr:SRPBCC family protein [Streptomyces lydicus]AOP48221.1 activator of HSP90 ATPase [Streptomyces lydicus]
MTVRAREWDVTESLEVRRPPAAVYTALADSRRMAEWSPEVWRVWSRGDRFVGFNRRALWVWFTVCRVVVADPGREYAFDVTSFGLPVARWGYRLTPTPRGTQVTEYWVDHRRHGWRRHLAELLGLLFTGTPAVRRAARNRAGMRQTLRRLAATCEAAD